MFHLIKTVSVCIFVAYMHKYADFISNNSGGTASDTGSDNDGGVVLSI